jgi:TonB-dependent SusC/RagA subfamily outer membrane receptor
LTGDNKPLFIVDGVPIDNQTLDQPNSFDGFDYGDGIGNINPDNIASVSVLKGPSAAALYGARGANGVILITTKSGQVGKELVLMSIQTLLLKIQVLTQLFKIPGAEVMMIIMICSGNGSLMDRKFQYGRGGCSTNGEGRMDGRPIVYDYAPEWGVQVVFATTC